MKRFLRAWDGDPEEADRLSSSALRAFNAFWLEDLSPSLSLIDIFATMPSTQEQYTAALVDVKVAELQTMGILLKKVKPHRPLSACTDTVSAIRHRKTHTPRTPHPPLSGSAGGTKF